MSEQMIRMTEEDWVPAISFFTRQFIWTIPVCVILMIPHAARHSAALIFWFFCIKAKE
jgi:hypothetical protein